MGAMLPTPARPGPMGSPPAPDVPARPRARHTGTTMAPHTDPPDPDPVPDRVTGPRRWTSGRIVVGVGVLACVAMWAYVFSPWSRSDPPGTLDDPAFAEAAQPVCAATRDQLDGLTPARESENPRERAEVVRRANVLLADMVDELGRWHRPTAPTPTASGAGSTTGRSTSTTARTLADTLATGEDARLLETHTTATTCRRPWTSSRANDMPACVTPDDVS
ncbi:MAG: hypothetical protein U5R31_10645 [Acidimicrobiia bacterium]|nr:hypothetical protein [Acidimicrobiia bacterium]